MLNDADAALQLLRLDDAGMPGLRLERGMTCKTCKHWDRRNAETPTGRLRPRARGRCRWEFPDVTLPDSIKWQSGLSGFRKPQGSSMGANDGEECETWEARI